MKTSSKKPKSTTTNQLIISLIFLSSLIIPMPALPTLDFKTPEEMAQELEGKRQVMENAFKAGGIEPAETAYNLDTFKEVTEKLKETHHTRVDNQGRYDVTTMLTLLYASLKKQLDSKAFIIDHHIYYSFLQQEEKSNNELIKSYHNPEEINHPLNFAYLTGKNQSSNIDYLVHLLSSDFEKDGRGCQRVLKNLRELPHNTPVLRKFSPHTHILIYAYRGSSETLYYIVFPEGVILTKKNIHKVFDALVLYSHQFATSESKAWEDSIWLAANIKHWDTLFYSAVVEALILFLGFIAGLSPKQLTATALTTYPAVHFLIHKYHVLPSFTPSLKKR